MLPSAARRSSSRGAADGATEFRLVPVAPSARRGLFGRLAGQVVFSPDYDTADAEISAAFDRHLDG
jgi:hypothetical protein